MTDKGKPREQLIDELAKLRQRIAELEKSQVGHKKVAEALRETCRAREKAFG